MIFYWYYISAFCAVYKNSQYNLIKSSFISYGIDLLQPFGTCFIAAIMRKFSLEYKKKYYFVFIKLYYSLIKLIYVLHNFNIIILLCIYNILFLKLQKLRFNLLLFFNRIINLLYIYKLYRFNKSIFKNFCIRNYNLISKK